MLKKKKNWLRYSTVDFSQEKANRHIKNTQPYLDYSGKKKRGGGYF